MILRWAAGMVCCLLALHPASAEKVFLIVAASSHQPAAIAAAAARLAPIAPRGLVVASSDCGDANRAFAFATTITALHDAAKLELDLVKRRIAADAYIKPCEVKPGSLLALRISAVDPSIAGVPRDAVNWTDADRISSVQRLNPGVFLAIVRRFVDERDDPLEGRRSRVLLASVGGTAVTISDTCFDPAHPAIAHGLIALDCVREEAGSHLLHAVEVTTTHSGKRLLEIPRCRTPSWTDRQTLTCHEEEVGVDGKLILRPKHVRIDGP